MCTYRINIDDAMLERVRPMLPTDREVEEWMQAQMDILLAQLAESVAQKPKKECLSLRLRGIANAPDDFDYKKELTHRFEA